MTWYDFFRRILFLPPAASNFARSVDVLHIVIIGVSMLVFLGILGAGIFFVLRYHEKKKNDDVATPNLVPGVKHEVVFIGVPLAIFLAWFVFGFAGFVKMKTPPKNTMDIYVMAKQWMWKFSYPQGPNSVGVLHVPANRPVRLLLTSRDVIHSFYVPAFRIKQDVLPDRYTEMWFVATKPGRYRIFCAEYCGAHHSRMWGEVVVMPDDQFDTWLDDQERGLKARQDMRVAAGMEAPGGDMVQEGEKIAAEKGCLRCHTVRPAPRTNGQVDTQHIGPTWVDLYQRKTRLTNGKTIIADEAYLTESMMDPMAKIVAGFKPVMPTYQGNLTGPQAAAIVEYIKSLRTDRVQTPPLQGPVYAPISHR